MVGNFNTDLSAMEVWEQEKGFAASLVEEGPEDMRGHFLPQHKPWLKYCHT